MNITELSTSGLGENAQALLESVGLKTKGVRLHPKHTAEVPQVIVDLAMEFPQSYKLLEAYSKRLGGTVSQYDWIGAPYNHGEARFSFEGNRSLLLVSVGGKHVCAVRGNDEPL